MRPRLLLVVGPTAAGKTVAALRLARALGGEIVSADSLAVYRGFDVGAAKPTADERVEVAHHLLDVASPLEEFHAGRFAALADQAILEIAARGRVAIVVGGTGLWIRALLRGLVPAPPAAPELRARLHADEARGGPGTLHARLAALDPATAARLEPRDVVRVVRALEVHATIGAPLSALHGAHRGGTPRYRALQLGVDPPRALLRARIAARVDEMLARGLLDEVHGLLAAGVGREAKPMRALGYKELAAHLAGELDLAEAARRIRAATWRLAKRQRRWFRADPEVVWHASADEVAPGRAASFLLE